MKQYQKELLFSVIFTLLFLSPWFFTGGIGLEHDTHFFLSRLEGSARALADGQFLPAVHAYKNNQFGYGSPLFYCDLLLVPFAGLYLWTGQLIFSYQVMIFCITAASAFTMYLFLKRLTDRFSISSLLVFAYLFSNYRITDTYVRSSVGELAAMIFFPLLAAGLHSLSADEHRIASWYLTISFIGLLLTHNLSFLMGLFLFAVFALSYGLPWIIKHHRPILFALLCSFLLTAWFTLPMVEQLFSQQFYLHIYGAASDLAGNAMKLSDYLRNRTVFGYSGLSLPDSRRMLTNPGWFLTFAPVYSIIGSGKESPFIRRCLFFGLLFLLLPLNLVPWQVLSVCRILQFPWRLVSIALPLLTAASLPLTEALLSNKKMLFVPAVTVFLTAEAGMHLAPVFTQRPIMLRESLEYRQLLSGELVDPCFSATYVRIELAGGDYLPVDSPDFRSRSTAIKDEDGTDLAIPYKKDLNGISLVLDNNLPKTYILPLTWYKGYSITCNGKSIPVLRSSQAMVSFRSEGKGSYVCVYTGTPLRTFSIWLSVVTMIGLIIRSLIRRIY